MHTHTKIICTIGPSVDSTPMITHLIDAGMNVARLNFSHGTHTTHLQTIIRLKEAREKSGRPLAIMLDTKGPEVRVGKISGDGIQLQTGQRLFISKEEVEGDENRISITPGNVLDGVTVGTRILFDDGYIGSRVIESRADGVVVEFENAGYLKSRKGVNIPNSRLQLPVMTEVDRADIRFGCEQDIDLIAVSFVRTANDVLLVKNYLVELGKPDILVMAKIENAEGVQNFDSIIQIADGVMIARGDLGVEVPLSLVPGMQKMMIRKAYLAGKPSITATQMLESMINNPRPTRAEVSDVANAIYDGTSSVMLSGETAIGRYPVETVQVMRSVVYAAEQDFPYRTFFDEHSKLVYHDVASSVTMAAVKTAYSANATSIFAFTSSGGTARLLSRLRPSMPIIAMTSNEKGYHQMAGNWGVVPFLSEPCATFDAAFKRISGFALERGYVTHGDLVVVTSGVPFGISGTTNTLTVESIGDVLVRGYQGLGTRVHGKVAQALSAESREPYSVRGQILILTRYDDSYKELVAQACGVLLQNHIDDVRSEEALLEVAKALKKSVIIRADAAMSILKEGQLVTMDPEKVLVYKGVSL